MKGVRPIWKNAFIISEELPALYQNKGSAAFGKVNKGKMFFRGEEMLARNNKRWQGEKLVVELGVVVVDYTLNGITWEH